jgi:hypothetical protein
MYTISLPSGTLRLNGEIVPNNSPDYASWLAAGNGPEPLQDPEPEFPRIEVSAWQIRKALNATGLRDAVEYAVGLADQETRDGWNHALTFDSDHPLALALGAALGKDAAAMHDLFLLAQSL